MTFKEKYNFWVDRKVAGFIYRFSDCKIQRHPIAGPDLWTTWKEFNCERACAKAWRDLCDQEAKENVE
jgi:hypothetical protein